MGCFFSKRQPIEGLQAPAASQIPQITDAKRTHYVAVVGRTGSGISQLICDVTRTSGHGYSGLGTQTQEISATKFRHPRGFTVVLIDTPGFDYSEGNDEYTRFDQLLEWVRKCDIPNAKLDGVIYMHEIWSTETYHRSPLNKCESLEALCGQGWHKKVILVTSHWRENIANNGDEREKYLQNGYWKAMLKKGSEMIRYESPEDHPRALEILDKLIQHGGDRG